MSVENGPDFVCIGMPSSGTRWLYDNLQAHEDTQMPLIKELHFLDRGFRERSVRNVLKYLEAEAGAPVPLSAADRTFLKRYAECDLLPELRAAEQEYHEVFKTGASDETLFRPEGRHFDWYDSLFDCYRPKMSGDITPGYWRLNSDVIEAFHARYPEARYLAILRNPVARVVSAMNKKVHKGLKSRADARRHLEAADSKLPRLLPSRAIEKWSAVVGREAILVLTLDDVIADPQATRHRIYDFLDLSTDPAKIDLSLTDNRKQNRFPNLLGDVDTTNLRRRYDEEIERCRALIGGATFDW